MLPRVGVWGAAKDEVYATRGGDDAVSEVGGGGGGGVNVGGGAVVEEELEAREGCKDEGGDVCEMVDVARVGVLRDEDGYMFEPADGGVEAVWCLLRDELRADGGVGDQARPVGADYVFELEARA